MTYHRFETNNEKQLAAEAAAEFAPVRNDMTPVAPHRQGTTLFDVDKGVAVADTDWLPKPFIANYEWQADAACRGMDSATFFHPTKEKNAQRRQRIAAAKAICDNCLAINACLAHALHAREPYGIWGGLSEYERARILGVHSLRYPGPVTAETSRRIERILLTSRQPQTRDDTTP